MVEVNDDGPGGDAHLLAVLHRGVHAVPGFPGGLHRQGRGNRARERDVGGTVRRRDIHDRSRVDRGARIKDHGGVQLGGGIQLHSRVRGRERAGHGTRPWSMNLEQQAIFLGVESLAGNIVSIGRPKALQSRHEYQGVVPVHWVEWEESAAGYPLLRSSQIAGCLLLSSTQPGYFAPHRMQLIQYYAELLAFVLEPEEFYDLSRIKLRTMPYSTEQKKTLTSFRARVAQLMAQSLRDKLPINLTQAEQIVWQQIEKELLHQQ